MFPQLLLLSFSLAAGGQPPLDPPSIPPYDKGGRPHPSQPGFHRLELTLDGGELQRYSLSVPDRPADQPAPLILALHYGGEVKPYYSMLFLKLLVAPAFRDLGAYILAPDCPGRGWTDPRSERAVVALLDHALDRWPIARQRVVVTGFSMGGLGTWFMAAHHPERFCAAVPVAGKPVEEFTGQVPIYAVHSRQDELIELEPTERAIAALKARGATAELVVVEGPTHYQTSRFVAPLRGAVGWLEGLWAAAPHPPAPSPPE